MTAVDGDQSTILRESRQLYNTITGEIQNFQIGQIRQAGNIFDCIAGDIYFLDAGTCSNGSYIC